MLLKTLVNKAVKYKSFICEKAYHSNDETLHILFRPRKNSKALCSKCKRPCPTYDTNKTPRHFKHIPIWGFEVFFLYRVRRVSCPHCGVKVEYLPWSNGKTSMTIYLTAFVSKYAVKVPWKEIAITFKIGWRQVYESVRWEVDWGLEKRDLKGIEAIGVDEIQWKKGHHYLTLVYDIINKKLLWIGEKRTEESFHKFFDLLGGKAKSIKVVCSDMWKPYLKVIKQRLGHAIHVLDKFHIAARLNKALDEVRASEHREMKAKGHEPILTKARWLLLKRPENLTEKEEVKLNDLVKFNNKTMRSYFIKEDFTQLWDYVSPAWASKFIDQWTKRVMLSKIEPMKREAKTIRKHKELILNYFKTKKAFSSGVVEGLNNKTKVTVRKSYGFRSLEVLKIALYHSMGDLPKPPLGTHRFW